MASRKTYKPKPVSDLQLEDLEHASVWKYVSGGPDETYVKPILKVPVASMGGKLACVKVTLANRTQVWAALGNVHENDPYSTAHFLTLSVFHDGRWFTLARYHDPNYGSDKGPIALAAFLGLPPTDVFPIHYDISFAVKGDARALIGDIEQEPKERLSEDELIDLAIGGHESGE